MTVPGVDVSNYQHHVDWHAVAGAGIAWVCAKASEGTGYRDPWWAANRAGTKANGLPCGAYHFARPGAGSATGQADLLYTAAPDADWWVLDLEATRLSADATTVWTLSFADRMKAHTGRLPVLYSGGPFMKAHTNGDRRLADLSYWHAAYPARSRPDPDPAGWRWPQPPPPIRQVDAWQYTSSAHVPGITGACDRNIAQPGTIDRWCAQPIGDDDMTPEQAGQLNATVLYAIQQQTRMGDTVHAVGSLAVPEWYRRYLGRDAAAGEVAGWVAQVDQGAKLTAVEAAIASSPEAKKYAKKKS